MNFLGFVFLSMSIVGSALAFALDLDVFSRTMIALTVVGYGCVGSMCILFRFLDDE